MTNKSRTIYYFNVIPTTTYSLFPVIINTKYYRSLSGTSITFSIQITSILCNIWVVDLFETAIDQSSYNQKLFFSQFDWEMVTPPFHWLILNNGMFKYTIERNKRQRPHHEINKCLLISTHNRTSFDKHMECISSKIFLFLFTLCQRESREIIKRLWGSNNRNIKRFQIKATVVLIYINRA